MTWETTEPLNSDLISAGPSDIRTLKADIQTSLRGNASEGTEAVFPGADASNPVYRYRGLIGSTGSRPSATDYGLYFNTTLNTVQRSNGSSWVDVGTLIPSGTVMVFYQASAPTGWTAVAANDKFLRVVTAGGTGGTTGGTVAASTSLAHTHTVASHTHTIAHTHDLDETDPGGGYAADTGAPIGRDTGAGSPQQLYQIVAGGSTVRFIRSLTGASSAANSGAATPATDSQLGAFAYADVIIATKD